ncbi:MAG: heterodisulfide reductase-related iron-sulfur binding cluster [Nitrososphaerota archaeon]
MVNGKSYAIFWGCTIPIMQPYVEKATRLVFEKLNVKLIEMIGATCCPEPEISRLSDLKYWRIIAIRNLTIAEEMNLNVLTLCNGCYDVLSEALKETKSNIEKFNEVNEFLLKINKKFKGEVNVMHAIEVLYDDIGLEEIKKYIVKPLKNLNVAIFNGCRLLKEEEKEFPKKFKELVEILNAKVVDYEYNEMCCGLPLLYSNQEMAFKERSAIKIKSAKDANADVLTVFCPACFNMLEKSQFAVDMGEKKLPIMNYMELLCLAMGFSMDDFGAFLHRIPIDNIIEKIEG